ncbi:MAG: hypothetical protein WBA43_22590 [Elainellaceae cyanobacterium]
MPLEKAFLLPFDPGVSKIEFMFNPSEITFSHKVNVSESPGAKAQESGKPKVSFSSIDANTLVINDIIFDTYEEQINVVEKYIMPFRQAVEFVAFSGNLQSGSAGQQSNSQQAQDGQNSQRTPLYAFVWGTSGSVTKALMPCCFIESLSYKLIMFLPDGTPVRAKIDSLTLKEADPSMLPSMQTSQDIDRVMDSYENRRSQVRNLT